MAALARRVEVRIPVLVVSFAPLSAVVSAAISFLVICTLWCADWCIIQRKSNRRLPSDFQEDTVVIRNQ